MNLFFLDRAPKLCAEQHCDKHVVKMILEYAQLLSTAHRILDGKHIAADVQLSNGKTKHIQTWYLPGEMPRAVRIPETEERRETARFEIDNPQCYAVAHNHHPLSGWVQSASGNYEYLFNLFVECCAEYTHRYGKVHSAEKLIGKLKNLPDNIRYATMIDPPLSMPDEYRTNDAVASYQNLYVGSKSRFAKWTNRKPPEWFTQRIPNYDKTNFERTR